VVRELYHKDDDEGVIVGVYSICKINYIKRDPGGVGREVLMNHPG